MTDPTELIVLEKDGVKKAYTREELEALAMAGVLPSQLGAEDPNKLIFFEENDYEDDFDGINWKPGIRN